MGLTKSELLEWIKRLEDELDRYQILYYSEVEKRSQELVRAEHTKASLESLVFLREAELAAQRLEVDRLKKEVENLKEGRVWYPTLWALFSVTEEGRRFVRAPR